MSLSTIKQANEAFLRNDFRSAKELYGEVLRKEPQNAFALFNYGLLETKESELGSGLATMEKAVSLLPGQAEFRFKLAEKYALTGAFDKSNPHLEAAIAIKPDYGHAYQYLTQLRSCEHETDLLQKLEHQLDRNTVPSREKCFMHFAAGKICADQKNYGLAFRHYLKANDLKNVTFNSKLNERHVSTCVELFDEQWVQKKKTFGLVGKAPLFVIGMPRSGTTLIEQMLSGHSEIFAGGELMHVQKVVQKLRAKVTELSYPELLKKTVESDILSLGLRYSQALDNISNGEFYVVNKLPQNFLHVGLIMLMFPNAKIVHVQRDALDTCLSCFFQNFTTGHEYSFSLKHLGTYFNIYSRLMRHWKSVYPNNVHTVDYESLVSNDAAAIKGVLSFLDLPWQEGCLDFSDNQRQVNTASMFQVRQPLHADSIGQWKNYEDNLQPLIDVLTNNVG